MRRSVRLLVALFAACQLVPHVVDADQFVITEHAIESVDSSDVENVKFVKYITISESPVDPGYFIRALTFTIPGRIFVDYADYKDGGELVNSSTVALIKVSGDESSLLDLIHARSYLEDAGMPPALVYFTMGYEEKPANVPLTGSLLLEVSLFHANAVNWLGVGSSPDQPVSQEVVVSDQVVYSATNAPQFSTDSSGYLNYTASSRQGFEEEDDSIYIATTSDASVYVVSTATPLNLYQLYVSAFDNSNVYVEGTSVAASNEIYVALQNETRFVALFDTLATDSLQLSPGERGEICLDVSESLGLGRDNSVNETQNVALPGKTGGISTSGSFACGKMQIPDRVPRDASLKSSSMTPSSGSRSDEASSSPSAPSDNAGSSRFPLASVLLASVASVVVVGLV